MKYNQFRLVDLFCGCGGMTEGFIKTDRFESVFANDFNQCAIDSYRVNFDPEGKHSTCGDIIAFLDSPKGATIPHADVVIGGPPCQGFSLLNKKREGDPRRELWYQYLRVVELCKAQVIVMENVPQLLGTPEYDAIEARLKELGFKHIQKAVLNAADYGVAEQRKRAIIMASKRHPITLPPPTHADPEKLKKCQSLFSAWNLSPWRTVRDVIGDLPVPKGCEIRPEPPPLDLHFGRTPTGVSLERYKAVPPGGNRFDLLKNRPDITPQCWVRKTSGGTDLFGRLWWNRPSVTIRTEFFKPEKGRYLHPEEHRPITHREAARIQSFPDNFKFVGTKVEIAKQIGNAVPSLLAQAIAKQVIACLEGQTDSAVMAETMTNIYKFQGMRG